MLNKSLLSFLILAALLVSGCTSKKPKITNQFRELASVPVDLTEEEEKLNDCFTIAKISCYELYSYEEVSKRWGDSNEEHTDRVNKVRSHFDSCIIDHSIKCSQRAGRDDLVQNLQFSKQNKQMALNIIPSLDWFFLSPTKINKFINFIRKVKEIKTKIASTTKKVLKTSKTLSIKMMHGTGVGLTGSVFAGVGTSFTGEAIILDGSFNLFCAPGLLLNSDIGFEANLSGVRALACENKESYKGKFLTIQGGVSAELLAIPAGIHAAYSFGVDTHKLLTDLIYYKRKSQLSVKSLAAELLMLQSVLPGELLKSTFSKKHQASLWLGIKLGMQMSDDTNTETQEAIDKEVRKTGVSLDDITKLRGVSLSHFIIYVIKTQTFQNILTKYKLRNSKIFFKSLQKSLTGCDSISGGVSVGLTLSPVNFGVQMTHYEEIFSADLEKILSLRNLSAFMFLNPFLMDTEMIMAISDLAKLVENFPSVIKNQCYQPAGQRAMDTFSLIDELRK